MTFIKILIVAIWKSRQVSGHTGGEICHFKLLNYLYLTIMWWERTQFSNSTFWRLVFSHSWFRIHLQLDFVSLEMNSEPLVWEHQSPKCFGGEPTILYFVMKLSKEGTVGMPRDGFDWIKVWKVKFWYFATFWQFPQKQSDNFFFIVFFFVNSY